MKNILIYLGTLLIFSACTPNTTEQTEKGSSTYKILVGTYTQKGSEGAYYYTLDENMDNPTQISHTSEAKNPSFLVHHKGIVYMVSEESEGMIQAYRFDQETGEFTFLNEQKTNGAHPCFIDVRDGMAYVANYTGGNFSAFPIQADGSLGEAGQTIANAGSGPNKDRQEKPHVHSTNVSPDGQTLWVADLGTDEVLVYDIADKKLTEKHRVKVTPGAGPRHIAFHPGLPVAYLITELANTVIVISTEDYSILQEIDTLSEGFEGTSNCADIHFSPDAKFLYGSNRFSDNLVIFSVNHETGLIEVIGHEDVKGKNPRNFAISPDGKYVLVTNQDSDNVVVFSRDETTGLLSPTGTEIEVSMPVCVKFL